MRWKKYVYMPTIKLVVGEHCYIFSFGQKPVDFEVYQVLNQGLLLAPTTIVVRGLEE